MIKNLLNYAKAKIDALFLVVGAALVMLQIPAGMIGDLFIGAMLVALVQLRSKL